MTRPLLLTSHMHNLHFSTMPITMSLFFVVLAVLSIFSIITFLCGTRKMKKKKYQTETEESRTKSSLRSKALSMVKLLTWRKVQTETDYDDYDDEEGDYGEEDEQVLWKKKILMGERCRPIDFSGKILYDSKGNMLPDLSHQNEYQQHFQY